MLSLEPALILQSTSPKLCKKGRDERGVVTLNVDGSRQPDNIVGRQMKKKSCEISILLEDK